MPGKSDLEALKKSAGRAPFERRLSLDGSGFAACPFHTGDSDKSMHLFQKNGVWAVTCFSSCKQTWGPIDFVMKFDNVTLEEAALRLGGKNKMNSESPQVIDAPKPKPKAMTVAEFEGWGRPLTSEDVVRFAKGRKGKGHTADYETWQRLGCRVKRDYIGFPYMHPNGEFLYTVKLRLMDKKEFTAENAAANDGFFNLDTVNPLEPVFICEGEPDVAVLQELGYNAVGVMSASQSKFDKHALEVISEAPEIYIIGDQHIPKRGKDPDPGQACMDALEAALAKVARKVYRIRFAVDGIEREKELKDVSALRQHYGPEDFQKRFTQLQSQAKEWTWVSENIPKVDAIPDEPQKWLVARMIPYGGQTILCGKKGSTKTLFAQFLTKYLTAPMPKQFLGRKIEGHWASAAEIDEAGEISFRSDAPIAPVPVLYIDRENSRATVGNRRSKIGILGRNNYYYWGDWLAQDDFSGENYPPGPDDPRVLKWAMRTRGFIVFDSLARFMGSLKENDNGDMTTLMTKFQRLARLCAGVLILHHTAKPSQDGPVQKDGRGADAITSVPDMSIYLTKLKDDAGEEIHRLEAIRFRDTAEWILDYKMNWNTDGTGNYGIGVVRDELVSEVAKRKGVEKVAVKEQKESEKAAAKEKAATTLEPLLAENPDRSLRELSGATGINREAIEALLTGKWKYDRKAKPKWARASKKFLAESPDGGVAEPY